MPHEPADTSFLRAAKDWPEADRLRKELDALNILVTDTPQGPKWSRKVGL